MVDHEFHFQFLGLSADGCGGDFKNTSGNFKLDSKSNDSVCTWYITTQKAGQVKRKKKCSRWDCSENWV